jgi:hypothetical protein
MKFRFRIVQLEKLSGRRATIYSALVNEDEKTLFDYFIAENIENYKNELLKIRKTIQTIAQETGARDGFVRDSYPRGFFDKHEGKVGQALYALYDRPDTHLRLYCFKFSSQIVILGGGGFKPKTIKALQQDPKLDHENKIMRYISDTITQAIKDGDLRISRDGMKLEGNLTFGLEDGEDSEDML